MRILILASMVAVSCIQVQVGPKTWPELFRHIERVDPAVTDGGIQELDVRREADPETRPADEQSPEEMIREEFERWTGKRSCFEW